MEWFDCIGLGSARADEGPSALPDHRLRLSWVFEGAFVSMTLQENSSVERSGVFFCELPRFREAIDDAGAAFEGQV